MNGVRALWLAVLVVASTVGGATAFVGVSAAANEAPTPDVSLDRTTYLEQRGDVAAVNITLSNTDNATVTVGDVGERNWAQNVTVEDGDGDGTVTLEFNTYTAGTSDDTNANGTPYTVFSVADQADSVTHVATAGGGFDPSSPADDTLAAQDYPIRAVAGSTPASQTTSGANATATLSIEGQSTEAVTTYVAPAARDDAFDSAADVAALRANGNVTETSDVADGDLLVTGIEASGLQGVLRNRTDTGADNATAAFLNERPGSDGDENAAFDARITETDTDPNIDNYEATLAPNNTEVVADPANDTYWLIVDTDEVPEFDAGDELETNFSVLENGGLADGSTVEVTDEWSIVERSGTLETNADVDDDGNDDEIAVRNTSGQAFTGTTTAAPGSELAITVQTLAGQAVGFFEQLFATVESDGTFTATANLSGGGEGTNFEVTVRDAELGNPLTAVVDGRVVRPLNPRDRSYHVSSTDTLSVPAGAGVLATVGNRTGVTPTASVDEEPSSGTLALRPNGSFEYEPDDSFTWYDSFTYEIVDGVGNAYTGTVTIDVEWESDDGSSGVGGFDPNDPPEATDDSYTVAANATLSVTADDGVLGADSDPDDDSDDLSATVESGPDNGAVDLAPDGSFIYEPDPGFAGTDAFTYEVSDDEGGTDTASVTITVEDHTPPTAEAGEDVDVEVGEPVALDGSGSSDNVGIDSYEWDLGDGQTASGETVEHTYDESGEYVAELTVTDASGNEDTHAVTVTVAEPAAFEIADLEIDEPNPNVGDTVTVSATIENDGGGEDTFAAALTVDIDGDESEVGEESVTLDGGESESVTYEYTIEEAGSYTLSVGDEAVTVEIVEDDDDDGDDTIPGFGVVIALVALLMAVGGRIVQSRGGKWLQ